MRWRKRKTRQHRLSNGKNLRRSIRTLVSHAMPRYPLQRPSTVLLNRSKLIWVFNRPNILLVGAAFQHVGRLYQAAKLGKYRGVENEE